MSNPLANTLADGAVLLEPFQTHHLEGLRQACAADQEIWEIYPHNMLDDDFDHAMAAMGNRSDLVRFAVCNANANTGAGAAATVVGMSNYINADMENGVVEIGGTYIEPSVRGTGFNGVMKRLMIEHAFAQGFRRIEFRVDERNKRSQAAVLKLGAQREGMLRKNRITWTGHVRDTCVFGLLENEWRYQGRD